MDDDRERYYVYGFYRALMQLQQCKTLEKTAEESLWWVDVK